MPGDELRLTITGKSGRLDASQLLQSAVWAGSCRQCARTLDFSIPVSAVDKSLPTVACELGSRVELSRGGAVLFDGYIFARDRDTAGSAIEVSCADRGLYLNRNQAPFKFREQTPEGAARLVCGQFGVPVGELAQTGVAVSRTFGETTTLYKTIQTLYTLAGRTTGERYLIRFHGERMEVAAKKQGASTLALRPGSNLISLAVSESVENMVNQVVIYDSTGQAVDTQADQEAVERYGLLQGAVTKSAKGDAAAQAQALLEDGQEEQKITAVVRGNPGLITGNCVVLQEPVTGLYGLCWIDGDSHTWKNGLHQTRLTLNFRNLMDEVEAGQVPGA